MRYFKLKPEDELLMAAFINTYNNEYTGDKTRLPIMKMAYNDPRVHTIYMSDDYTVIICMSMFGTEDDYYASNVEIVSMRQKFSMKALASVLSHSKANAFIFKCNQINKYTKLVEYWGGFHLTTDPVTGESLDCLLRRDMNKKIDWDIMDHIVVKRRKEWITHSIDATKM